MKKLAGAFNANTVLIMLVSALLCWMQKKVLDAVWELPSLVYQVEQIRLELRREEQDRKDADEQNRQRLKLIEDFQAKFPKQP